MAEKVVIAEIDIKVDGVIERQSEILEQQKKLKDQQKEYTDAIKKGNEVTADQTEAFIQSQAQMKNLSKEYSQNTQILAARQKVEADGIKTVEDARSALAAVSIQWAKVTKVEGENSERAKELAANKLILKERINELQESTGDYTGNVGNYTNSIIKAVDILKKQAEEYKNQITVLEKVKNSEKATEEERQNAIIGIQNTKLALQNTKGELARYGETAETSGTSIESLTGKMGPVGQALGGFASGAKTVGGTLSNLGSTMKTLIANPFFAIIAVVASIFMLIKEAIGKNAEIMDKLAVALKPVQLLFGKIMDVVGKLVEVLVGGLADAMEWVADLFDGASDSTKKYTDAVKNLQEIEDKMVNQKIKDLQLQEEINKLDEIAADRTKTKEQRLNALTDSIKKQKEIASENAKLQDDQLKNFAINLQGTYGIKQDLLNKDLTLSKQALERLSEEDKKALVSQVENYINAKNRKSEIDKEAAKKRSTLEKGIEDEEKDANEKAVAERQKRNEKVIKLLDYELKYFNATNKSKLDSNERLTDSIVAEEEKRIQKQFDIATKGNDKAFKLGLKSKQEYELAKIEIENNAESQREALGNARLNQIRTDLDIELREYLLANESKLKGAKELTSSLVTEETLRIEQLKTFELEKLALSEESETEKEIKRKEIISASNSQIADLNMQFATQQDELKKEQLALQLEAENIIKSESMMGQFEVERQATIDDYDKKLKLAQGNSAATIAIEKAKSQALREINKKELDAKFTAASQFAGNLATIFGKQTKLGKAAATAQVAIDGIKGGIAAFTGMAEAIPGPVGLAAGAVAAAAVGVMAAKSIQDIWAVNSGLPENGGGNKASTPPIATPPTPTPPPQNYDGGFSNTSITGSSGQTQPQTQTVLVVDEVTFKQNQAATTNKVATL